MEAETGDEGDDLPVTGGEVTNVVKNCLVADSPGGGGSPLVPWGFGCCGFILADKSQHLWFGRLGWCPPPLLEGGMEGVLYL